MQLSESAKKRLRKILSREIGQNAEVLSDVQINDLGIRLLQITAEAMKRKLKVNS